MAFSIGAAFGGFAQGLNEGVQSGVNIAQRQEQMELQKAEGKLRMMSALNNLSNMPEEARKAFGPAILKQFEKSYGTEIPEPLKAIFIKGNSEQNKKMIETLMKAASDKNFDISKVGEVIGSMPLDKQMDVVSKIISVKSDREKFEETKRHSRAVEGISAANAATSRMVLAESRAERAERRAEREQTQVSAAHRDILDNASKNLTGPGVTDYEKKLSGSQAYAAAVKARDTKAMYDIASKIRQGTEPEMYAPKGQNDVSVNAELRAKYTTAAQNETDPVKKKKYQELAELYERKERLGGKELPATYVQFLESTNSASRYINKAVTILRDPAKGNVLSPKDRAELGQAISGLVLQMATVEQRGANFTDTEQKLIRETIGGNPNDILSRALRSRGDFIERLRTVHELLDSKVQSRERALIGGRATIEPFPAQKQTQTEGLPLPRMRDGKIDLKGLEKGKIYISPNGRRGRWNGGAFEEIQ